MSYDAAGSEIREMKRDLSQLMEDLIEQLKINNAHLQLMTDEEDPPRDD